MVCTDCGEHIEDWVLEQYPDANLCAYCSAGMGDNDDSY